MIDVGKLQEQKDVAPDLIAPATYNAMKNYTSVLYLYWKEKKHNMIQTEKEGSDRISLTTD